MKGSILDFKGKAAIAGPPVLYHLASGQLLYSEDVREDGDSYVFDGDKTLLVQVSPGERGQLSIAMAKLGAGGFRPKMTRVAKNYVALIQDCGDPAIIQKAHEALSGLVLPGSTHVPTTVN